MPSDKAQLIGSAPYFLVKDLVASVRYFHTVLGFSNPPLWGEPPEFAMPSRDDFTFMLKQAPEGATIRTNGDQTSGDDWDAYVWIKDANSLFEELKSRGAQIEYEPVHRPHYDMVEFAVRDLDRHIIAFGQHHESEQE